MPALAFALEEVHRLHRLVVDIGSQQLQWLRVRLYLLFLS